MAATAQNHMEPLRSGDGKKDEDRDDELEYSPFYGIEKGAVLQEARVFNEAHADPRRCQQVITKLLYLLTQGESLTKTEASDVFFAVTKLFQHKDVHLRRMVYLVIKEVIPASDEVIIITSSLMKDMNSSNELYRANAIRVLCRIIDPTMLLQIERYLKQAVVDKSAVVATAVLAGATLLSRSGADVIKRWTSEIGEAMASRQPMVTYHAVALTHALRAADRLAVNKLVTQLTRGGNGVSRSPMAQCLLSCLRHKSEVVIFEAARAICALRDVTARELTPAVTVLQLFLSSAKPVLRFAAVRTLNRVAMAHPLAVTNCNIDMEGLISDPNRSVATLAITTLLKTSNESSIDRLLKQIGGFMGEIGDEFKVVVVEAITALCLKFPAKHRGLMAFLAAALREDGGHAFKRAVAAALTRLVAEIPEAREAGLAQLAEFIEDCEFTSLSVQILHLLGREGPTAPDPARFVRLTEEETEYKVDAVAHVLADRVVLAFTVVNTVAEQVLEGEIDPGLGEPEEEGYEDEYSLEDLELGLGCFVAGAPAPAGFRALWDSLPEDSERVDDYALGARESLADAARALGELFNGFAPVDGSDAVPPGARSHALLLAGALPDGGLLAVRLALGLDRQRNVAMKLAVRASDSDLAEAVHAVVQDA
ncbi:Coatomer subunit gamma [Auxenochlorella protothecoides]|uniref:Coatomer subunit gamma n=1 Tax=Auxenochlorella protothecoides TaxID=3075 RepID=A0A087SFQ5_AUXPR|nr:Coatomer subunit gamma [Auxenochlorella protothecoides]KFM24559.1 Coatomer subunit gamma [Auxenochlorella protothecoides]